MVLLVRTGLVLVLRRSIENRSKTDQLKRKRNRSPGGRLEESEMSLVAMSFL